MTAAETPTSGEAAGAASEGAAAAGEQEVAAGEPPVAGEVSGAASEGASAAGEQQVATAEPPQAGEAGVGQPGEQVAAGEAAAPVEEPLQRIEIGPVEASVPTDTASAVSAEGTLAVSSPLTATAEGQTEDLSVTVEATPGAIETSEVKIKAAEAEAGTLYVAGEAPPGMLVRIYANNELVGEARASNDGTWLLEAKRDVPVGEVVFRVEAASESGQSESPIVEAAVPFMRYADGVVLEPVVTATTGDQPLLSEASAPRPTYVIIRRGDNLWRIARRNYGRGIKYQAIFAANRDSIKHPHWIFPGQVFIIPTRDRSWETVTN